MKPLLAISMGDYNGIGPEITLKCCLSSQVRGMARLLLIGSIDTYSYYAERLHLRADLTEVDDPASMDVDHKKIPVYQPEKFHGVKIQPGELSADAGKHALAAIKLAAQLCLERKVDGMVTAPIAKEAMQKAGLRHPGHTELLAELTGAKDWIMMLVADTLRVGLVTIHIPLKQVAPSISQAAVRRTITVMQRSLVRDFNIEKPRIAVLGLNPHAGEGGMLGTEEANIIAPALQAARRQRINAEGPFPADGFFGSGSYRTYDGIVAMYHDQGLIPLKLLGFSTGVNYTAGLPIVRTSPDHGTAFAIAGKGVADSSSMTEAIELAVSIVKKKQKG